MKRGIYIVCILLLLLYVLMGGKEEASASLDETSIYFFHDTACGSCDGTEDFLAVVSEQISGYKEVFPYRLVMYNVFKSEERDSAQGILAEYGLSMEEASFPMLLIDGKVYEGVGEIEANLKREYLSSVGSGAVYFYREDCQECIALKSFLDGMPRTVVVDGVEMPFHLTRLNSRVGDNGKRIWIMFEKYGVPEEEQIVPVVILRDRYLAGGEKIKRYFMEYLEQGYGLGKVEIK